MALRRKRPEPPISHLTEAEMDAILAEPIWETVQRGEAVALEPYAKNLFALMASFCPPIRLQPQVRPVVHIVQGPPQFNTGASAAYSVCASVATVH